jgi:adenylate cyclase
MIGADMMNNVPSRRLAAIVSADIKGYSALMGIDEVGTLDALRDHRQSFIDPKINEYSGRIVKTTGDGLLLEFPSVVNAVQCCLELQSGMRTRNRDVPIDRRIIYRIGINLGDVISEDDDIFGDGVNIAARLESIADPGGICVSQAVADQLKRKLDVTLDDLGKRALKNIETPVRVFRLAGAVADHTTSHDKPASPRSFNPRRPSLAILPFRNVGPNPEAEFLAEGIALGIQTLLVQLSGIFFINACRNQKYQNGEATATEIGRELSVQYVLEGSVQRFGNRVRVMPQLTDLEAGATIWASRFDQELEDIFELQDEITHKVVTALSSEILGPQYDRIWTSHLKQPGAWELYLRGISHHYKFSPQDNVRARGMFEELHALVPDSAIPIGNIARSHWADFEGR